MIQVRQLVRTLGAAACSLGLLLSAGCQPGGPEGTLRHFYRSVEKGEIEDALDVISRESVSTPDEREKLRTLLREQTREIAEKGGIDRLELTERSEYAELADFEVTIIYGNGTADHESVSLVKEEGKWRIRAEK